MVTEENLDFESSCVAISPDGGSLAVGDSAGMAVHIYQVSAGLATNSIFFCLRANQ